MYVLVLFDQSELLVSCLMYDGCEPNTVLWAHHEKEQSAHRQDGGITIRMRTTLLQDTSCHTDIICLISFLCRAGECTDLFGTLLNVKTLSSRLSYSV